MDPKTQDITIFFCFLDNLSTNLVFLESEKLELNYKHSFKFIGTDNIEEPPSLVLVCSSSLEVCFDLLSSLLDRTPSESVLSSIGEKR